MFLRKLLHVLIIGFFTVILIVGCSDDDAVEGGFTMPIEPESNFTFVTNGGTTIEITDYIGSNVIFQIPAVISGLPVTSIAGDGLMSKTELKMVVLPDSIIVLGQWSFADCENLTNIVLGANIESIERYAFENCYALTSVTLPNSLTNLATSAFNDCRALKTVVLGTNICTIENDVFRTCYELSSINIPENITNIGTYSFNHCDAMTSIDLGENLSELKDSAFSQCSNLSFVTCRAAVPPTLGSEVFNEIASSPNLYVPAASFNDYTNSGWTNYFPTILAY